ncbi:YqaE/Pmp3 family membrane protein [Sphingomonas sanxanigenens]|uniref:YqaE/Pmp3 family membrane protein n=1 Tax=Sphingomonas sanxanigenens DSM 19645 = NX02 TaxID=1123269 RepID=W0AJM3_9SPHN|nr:YqaE/Pmp3 family membrane protein [Sphingomonas sanxanigenens]AHE56772.1 hypothetical protein NX02_25835 [Sphingomonas sanxanigenens DSM 19645 = NX02]
MALLIRIVAAVLLPPLGVFLTRGIGRDFWIDVILTLLAYVPGVVYALWVIITDNRRLPATA